MINEKQIRVLHKEVHRIAKAYYPSQIGELFVRCITIIITHRGKDLEINDITEFLEGFSKASITLLERLQDNEEFKEKL
jgi:hypothetical protein